MDPIVLDTSTVDLDTLSIDMSFDIHEHLSPDFLFLVVRGGCGLQSGMIDATNHDIDFRTLKETLQEVLNTHYQFARGRVIIKSVPCPNIGTKAHDVLSSLSPAQGHNRVTHDVPAQPVPNFSFPVSALPILAGADPTYVASIRQLVISANIIYRDFLESEEGDNFSGHVCIMADCLGSVLIYDILSRHGNGSPATTPTIVRRVPEATQSSPTRWRKLPSPVDDRRHPLCLNLAGSFEQPLPVGVKSLELSSSRFMFEVSNVFMFGSSLGYILAHRQMTGSKS